MLMDNDDQIHILKDLCYKEEHSLRLNENCIQQIYSDILQVK